MAVKVLASMDLGVTNFGKLANTEPFDALGVTHVGEAARYSGLYIVQAASFLMFP